MTALPGVVASRVGYCGGKEAGPTYKRVCSDPSFRDYAETIQIDFDPLRCSYEEVIQTFFRSHDYKSHLGRQYASVIFYHTEEQHDCAQQMLESYTRASTAVEACGDFWVAEAYHQKWLLQRKRPLFLSLGLRDASELLLPPAAVLNTFAAGRISAETALERLEALVETETLRPDVYNEVKKLVL